MIASNGSKSPLRGEPNLLACSSRTPKEETPRASSRTSRETAIKLLDLATHRSGLPRLPDNFKPANPANPYADYHASDLYAFLNKHGLAKPAPPFDYSNLEFGLLGLALANRASLS